MRTTVDLPDALYRRAKIAAAERGISLKQMLLNALDAELSGSRTPLQSRRPLPVIGAARTGPLRSWTNAEIDALLD